MIVVKELFNELSDDAKGDVGTKLRELIKNSSYLVRIELNLAYAVRVLGQQRTDENEQVLAKLYRQPVSDIVKRDIVLIMAKWGVGHWLSDQKTYYHRMNPWVQRAFLIASYRLGDEGRHWRQRVSGELFPFEQQVRDWCSEKAQQAGWTIPI